MCGSCHGSNRRVTRHPSPTRQGVTCFGEIQPFESGDWFHWKIRTPVLPSTLGSSRATLMATTTHPSAAHGDWTRKGRVP